MRFRISIQTIYECTLERAFKTPMLSDITKVHTGLLVMPRVTHCTDDAGWGRPGSSKKVFVAPSLTQKGGWASVDRVLERVENQYWKIEVSDFKAWMLDFEKFTGEWETMALSPGKIQVRYTYTLHTRSGIWFPFQWLFAKVFWPLYMRQILANIRTMIHHQEPFLFD